MRSWRLASRGFVRFDNPATAWLRYEVPGVTWLLLLWAKLPRWSAVQDEAFDSKTIAAVTATSCASDEWIDCMIALLGGHSVRLET